MTIHLRLDETGPGHKMFTVFINGTNSGRLTATHQEALGFVSILQTGVGQSPSNRLIYSGLWEEIDHDIS
jgi:hypothetical protein